MLEKHSYYKFEIIEWMSQTNNNKVFIYYIFEQVTRNNYWPLLESKEWFGTKEEARKEAINHINRLENGES